MKMAKASQADMHIAWKLFHALEVYRYRKDARAKQLVLGRILQLDDCGGYFRLLGGYEMLVENCCDDSDTLEYSPQIQRGLALEAAAWIKGAE